MKVFDYKKAYYLFLLIRKSEEKIIELYDSDKIKSPVHLSIGQEGIAVGVSLAASIDDIIFSNYRGHAHYIAIGGNLNKMWAEFFGKIRGTARGKGGSMHLNDWSKKFMSTSAIVSTSVSEAVGYAFALKYQEKAGIVICYHGDGAAEEGAFWESLNFASLHKLPILFICENNKYAIYTHQSKRLSGDDIYKKASTFGIKAEKLSKDDTLSVFNETDKILKSMSKESTPHLLEIDTHRWFDHVGVGTSNEFKYRDKSEITKARINDNLLKLEQELPEETVKNIKNQVQLDIQEAVDFAESSEFPKESELLENVYG
jgi:TPP-dependent pyruvate/acetoin dehydrogenase alpha subunit